MDIVAWDIFVTIRGGFLKIRTRRETIWKLCRGANGEREEVKEREEDDKIGRKSVLGLPRKAFPLLSFL
jgi:hypothetical protein